MLLRVALVVFSASIVVFFAQEFGRLFKKILSIPGFKLLLPLVLASWVIELYEIWGQFVLLKVQKAFHLVINATAGILPFSFCAISLTRIVFLFVLSSLPLFIYRLRAKQQGRRHPEPVSYWIGLTIWVVASILLTVSIE